MTYAVVDLETTINTSFKRKANPFDERNWVVMAGWKRKGDSKPHGIRLRQGEQQHEWFHEMLVPDTKFIVGHNIKFDMLHLLKSPLVYAAWKKWVAAGGLVWDTQLAEYLLDGQLQSSHMLSLDEVSLRYGGDTKVDEVKKLWEAGVPTEEIDRDLLARYLLGEDLPNGERREGDIGNTERVFLGQLDKARNRGQSRSILLNMGALLATIEMERNGMHVNVELGKKLAAELEVRLHEAEARLQEYLPADLPFKFSWTNRYHLSPMIFGGKIKYQRRQYDLKDGRQTWYSPDEKPHAAPLFAYAQRDQLHWVCNDGVAERLVPAVDGEDPPADVVRYASGKQKGEAKTKKVKVDDYTKPKSRMADCWWEFPGHTEPKPEWASSTEGLYSCAAEVIEELGNRNIPFLKDLSSVKAMEKDLGTYFIKWDEEKQQHTGMLTLVQPDSIIHHSLNHTSTVTGRFSSSNPNLQNIPKGNKSDVKQVFESRWGEDGLIGQSDFSSLEVYVQAILTACRQLIEDLKAGTDMHCMRLAVKEKMDYDEVLKLCKGYVDAQGIYQPAIDEWDYKRTGAKVFSFQRAYGAGAQKIADSTGMAREDVDALILAEQERYPEIDAYFAKRTEEIQKARVPTSRFVQHPDLPAVTCQLGLAQVHTPDGKVYSYIESPAPAFLAKRGQFTSFSPTEIKNYEVQGTGGEWMKAALWLGVRAFYARDNFGGLALLVNTVHDAKYTDNHKSVAREASALMHACMEGASDFMEWWFNWPLPLPVPSDTVLGKNMGEENKCNDAEWKALARAYRLELRKQYMGNHQPTYEKEQA